MIKISFSILFVFLCYAGVQAHRLNVDVELHPPVIILKASFFAGQPVQNALVTIYSPGEASDIYQTGRTDKAGYFVFLPEKTGDWSLLLDDEKGHRRRTMVSLDAGFFEPDVIETEDTDIEDIRDVSEPVTLHQHAEPEIPMLYRLIFGLALIFGLTGILYGVKSRQSIKK